LNPYSVYALVVVGSTLEKGEKDPLDGPASAESPGRKADELPHAERAINVKTDRFMG
jgi:hypothetical protein